MAEDNGDTAKATWWMVGLVGTGLILLISFLLNMAHQRMEMFESSMRFHAQSDARQDEHLRILESALRAGSDQRLELAREIGALNVKGASIEARLVHLEEHHRQLLERLTTLQDALQARDRCPPP